METAVETKLVAYGTIFALATQEIVRYDDTEYPMDELSSIAAKELYCRLIKLQPGEYVFQLLIELGEHLSSPIPKSMLDRHWPASHKPFGRLDFLTIFKLERLEQATTLAFYFSVDGRLVGKAGFSRLSVEDSWLLRECELRIN